MSDEYHLLTKDSKWYSTKTQKTYTVLDFATNATSGERCVMYGRAGMRHLLTVDKFLSEFKHCPPPPIMVKEG